MPKRKVITTTSNEEKPPLRPALTVEGRESQMISLAMDLAEQRLRDGTATSQEVVHFLKLGAAKNRLEEKKLEKEIELLEAKKENLEAQERQEEKFNEAIKAFGIYSGQIYDDDSDDIIDSEGDF